MVSIHGKMEENMKVKDCVNILGDYYMDKKHGHGVYTWADGRKYDGMWENGKQHGEGVYYDINGIAKRGIWENGKRTKWIDNDMSKPQIEDDF